MNPKDLIGKTIADVDSSHDWITVITFADGTKAGVRADWDYRDNGGVKVELRWDAEPT